jgi:pantoate--beta-alanine ligase
MTDIIRTVAEIQKYVEKQKRQGNKVGLIPSMGAFHQGHLTLMNRARKECGAVIVSVFVNPIQFSAGEDYDQYPRQPERDMRMAESEEVDILFIPEVAQMYPKGFDTHVEQSEKGLPSKLCGPFRPGHFRGVMTVVLKMFSVVRPDLSYFGQKDYQQFLIIRRMSLDLNLGVEVRICPTVREEDGLAMSSRNIYLGPKQRKDAVILHDSLMKAKDMTGGGESSAAKVIAAMKKQIRAVKGSRVDYIAVVNSETLEPLKEIKGKTLIALSVRIGKARLIDNILL